MRAIIVAMLAVQAAIFLVAIYTMVMRRSAAGRRQPVWSSLAVALIIVAGTSWRIGDRHAGEEGADILMYGSPLLLGMGIMAALMLIQRRRGLDAAP